MKAKNKEIKAEIKKIIIEGLDLNNTFADEDSKELITKLVKGRSVKLSKVVNILYLFEEKYSKHLNKKYLIPPYSNRESFIKNFIIENIL